VKIFALNGFHGKVVTVFGQKQMSFLGVGLLEQ
jgi:hypothetical protein